MEKKPAYDIDDILAEAARLKQQRGAASPSAPSAAPKAGETADPVLRPAPFASPSTQTAPEEPPALSPQPVLFREEAEEPRRRFPFFSRRKEEEDEAWQSIEPPVVLQGDFPKPEPVRPAPPAPARPRLTPLSPVPPEPAAPVKEEPPVQEPVDAATRILEIPGAAREKPAEEWEGEASQLRFADIVGEEEDAPARDEDAESLEEKLRQSRLEKIEEFQKKRESHRDFKLSGDEEEVNDPSEEPEVYTDEEIEDYNSLEETDAVVNELSYRRRAGWIGIILTASLEAVLAGMAVTGQILGGLPMDAYLLISLQGVLLLIMMLVNHQMVGGGLASFLRLQADGDSAVGAASLAALIQTAAQFFHPADLTSGAVELLAPAAGLVLLLGALGRQARVARICRNFRFVSYPGEKYAARRIEDVRAAEEIGRPAVALGEPQVAYFRGTPFLTHFLEQSYADDGTGAVMRVFVPLSVGVSALLGLLFGLLHPQGWWTALSVFAAAVCVSAPAALTAANFPLLRGAKKALARGGMVAGWNAVREFGRMHTLVVDAADLFPSESVLLHGIKTFAGARIDEAILDAAAVSIAAGGPLAAVFRRVIEDKLDILPAVDSLVYEQDMGLSGWVAGRRVLVGNRRLLENHGVDVPSRDYELRYTKNNRQLVYLSVAGELSAMFVISYVADEGIVEALQSLEKAHITLLVRTCDPNVTQDLICNTLGIDNYYVEMMGNAAGRTFSRILEEPLGETPAVLASNGRIEGMAAAVSCCHRLRIGAGLGIGAQIVAAGLGLAASAILAFHSGMALPVLILLAYLLVSAAVSWILPCVKRI